LSADCGFFYSCSGVNLNREFIFIHFQDDMQIRAGRQKPYYIKADGLENGVYIRVSGTTRSADREMSRELYYECDGHAFDSVIRRDLKVTDEDIDTLCKQMKEVAIANSKSDFQRVAVKNVTKNVLISWGILKRSEDGNVYPTNAYFYLTGQGGLRSMIQCGVFKGTTRAVFLDRRNYEVPLWKQVDEAVKFVLRNIRMGCRLEGVYRQDIYELPPDSIRELIVNAVMHKLCKALHKQFYAKLIVMQSQLREWFVKMEQNDPEALEIWNWFKDISMVEFERIYDLLGISKHV
jgi:hypothetical protein